ncbi:MAG TPA: discoidin domain-containing protein [Polyangiales bacterium]|nr:discoidin domain-containing protein [Polyangiales bacterium]
MAVTRVSAQAVQPKPAQPKSVNPAPSSTTPAVTPAKSAPAAAPTAAPAAPAATTPTPEATEPAAPVVTTPDPCTDEVNLLKNARSMSRGTTGRLTRATDDTLAEEGTFWSSADAVVMPAASRFEYDLKSVKTISAVLVQGDNNDEYVFEGSVDGVTYKPIWVAPATFVGMGLRTRWAVLPAPGTARYLRVVGRGGDGYYSVSEVQAFCKRPAVFPPQLKLPPKKYGWDAIDNDVMVNVKGVTAVIAAVLLLGAYFRRFYELRIQSIGWRGFSIGLFALTSLISIWLAGLADTGTATSVTFWASIVKWAREQGAGLLYSAAGAAFVAALLLIGVLRAKRSAPVFGALGATLLTALAGFALWMAALNPQGETVASVIKWAKDHGSAPGFYYTAALLFSTAIAVSWLCLRQQGPRLFDTGLAITGLFCFFAWWNIGHYHFDHYVHIWEHYHYITGAKYPELRYKRLYQCTAVADLEDGLKKRVQDRKMRRIESDNKLGTSEEIIAHPEICKSLFPEPKRWEQFRQDIRFFRGRFSLDRWDESQNDHGYNATPVWAILGRFISEHIELTWDNIVNLGIIDSVYLIAMWLTVLWAFGWRAAAVAAVYWGCNFPARFYWNGGSFLRYDWQLWLVVGICFLRKRKHFFGGAALTYGALLRIFPGFVVAALVLKAIAGMVRERRFFLTREHQRFAAGCVAALALLMPLSGWATNGLDAWPEFAVNSKKHLETALTNNMGLKTVMGYDFATRAIKMRNDKLEDPFQDWKDAKEYFYSKRAPLYYFLILAFCVLLARAGDREEEDWVAACLGAGLIVMAAELTCYYYGFLLTYGLLWDRRRIPGILAAILAAFTCFIYDLLAWNDDHFAAMSLASVIVVIAVTANSAFGKRFSAQDPGKVPSQPAPARAPTPSSIPIADPR